MHVLLYKRNHLIEASGGAEKIMVMYANEFSARGYKVTLATRDNRTGNLFFPLDKEVTFKHFHFSFNPVRRFLGKFLALVGLIKHFPYFNRELLVSDMLNSYCQTNKVDIVIVAGIQELIDFTAYGERAYPVIMMMHSHPKAYFNKKRYKLYCKYINNADAIQVLMPSYKAAFPKEYKGTIDIIGNPVPDLSGKQTRDNTVIYLARIEKNKQHHLAIEAFAKIAHQHPDWQLHLYGSETNKKYADKCKSLIETLGMQKQIFFKGVTQNPAEKLQKAKICAFPSLFEGFSLALTEAMSAGLPCVGFSSCTGVNEQIQDNVNGFLADDVQAFSSALDKLMSDDDLCNKMGKEAQKLAGQFSMDAIINRWTQLINRTLGDKNAK